MKVEDKNEVPPFKDNSPITFILPWYILVLRSHELHQQLTTESFSILKLEWSPNATSSIGLHVQQFQIKKKKKNSKPSTHNNQLHSKINCHQNQCIKNYKMKLLLKSHFPQNNLFWRSFALLEDLITRFGF